MSEEYYKLNRSDNWLPEGDTPFRIGNRDTEIDQIYFSLAGAIKTLYPINEVPESIAQRLRRLQTICNAATDQIQTLIDEVSLDIRQSKGY